ncbi:hypothetical protein V6N13_143375 [Hibiscus sabdariffa]
MEKGYARWYAGIHLRRVIVEVDSEDALQLIFPNPYRYRYLSVVNHIDDLVQREWIVQCRCNHRNGNKVTDVLAKLVDSSHLNCLCFSVPPSTVDGLLQADTNLLTVL